MSRKFIALLLALTLVAAHSPAQQTPAQQQSLRRGQTIRLATLTLVSSVTAKKGDDIALRVMEPLTWQSVTLLAAGDVVHGRVKTVKRAKRDCNDGEVSLEVSRLKLRNSATVKTKIGFVSRDPDAKVPAELPTDHLNPAAWTFLGPVAAVALPLYGPYAAGEALVRHCSGLGNHYVLPAGATVAVVIVEDYTVNR